ncbi:hypothetical protein V6N11_069281 [Hibiscus sabdariffa]|uniref:Polygalacturonase n=1 Tax=Hibiscus sabdariffa TaxID=183260 RepID=A0ABR1ZZ47_9ROSI
MEFAFGFTVFLLIGFALGNEIFSEETIAAFNLDFENEILGGNIADSFNVMDYGAVGNGIADDSQAFIKAWKGVCGAKVGGTIATLVVPQGKTFLVNLLEFEGPCQAKSIHVQLEGTLIAPETTSWENGQTGAWINFKSVDNLILDGGGKIDGRGSNWWQPCKKTSTFGILLACNDRPGALFFHNCNGLRLKGLTHLDSPKRHIGINGCKDVVVSDLLIKAPEDSPNTDGIDISDSTNVLIQDSTIETGDDCVAINGGSSFINVTGVNCGPGHGIRKISFENILLNNVDNPIIINQFYQDKGKLRSYGLFGKASAIEVSDVTYSDIQGTSASKQAIDLNCDNVVGCTNIVMKNIHITASADAPQIYSFCNNAHGTAFDVSPKVTCLS